MSMSYESIAQLLKQQNLILMSLVAENEMLRKELDRISPVESSMTLQEATKLATELVEQFWSTNFESSLLGHLSVLDEEYEMILLSDPIRELIRQSMIYALYHQKNYEA